MTKITRLVNMAMLNFYMLDPRTSSDSYTIQRPFTERLFLSLSL